MQEMQTSRQLDHDDDEHISDFNGARLRAGCQRSALGARRRARPQRRRKILVLGRNDGRSIAARPVHREPPIRRTSSFTPRWRRPGRPAFGPASAAIPTARRPSKNMQAIVANACRRIELGDGETVAGRARQGQRLERRAFSSHLQDRHRRHPKALCLGAARGAAARGALPGATPSRRRSMMQASIPAGGSMPSRPTCSA